MRRRTLTALIAVTALVLTTGLTLGTASGEEEEEEAMPVRTFVATLSGANEIGPTGAPGVGDPDGSGTATVQLVGETTVCWSITVKDVLLPGVGAHIHRAPAGANGPIVVPLANPNLQGMSAGCVTAEAALVAAIEAQPANYYVNVHTRDFPAGAVRGQLTPGDCFFDPEAPPAVATIVGNGTITGTPGPDVIVGGDGPDTISGLGGNDIICGEGGDDQLDGGDGDDILVGDDDQAGPPFGPGGDDILVGGFGDDTLLGLGGDDTALGGDGADTLIGFGGNDRLFGGVDGDTIFAGPGDDVAFGDNGNDTIFGNFGSDVLIGGADDDEIDGDNPNPSDAGPPGGPTESANAVDTCLNDAGTDRIFNCERGSPSTPRAPQGAPQATPPA
jgi:Ca2+-binding RTX toxin-like protein